MGTTPFFYTYFCSMRNLPVILLVCVLFLSCNTSRKAAGGSKLPQGAWQPTPIAIDGDSKDWPSPYPNFDSKAKIAYASSNDGQYLYVTFQTGDELTQAKIMKAGMQLTIDTTGRKDAQFTIKYPLENTLVDYDLSSINEPGKDMALQMAKKTNQFVKKALEQANQLSVDGFKDCKGGYTISQPQACGIKVKMRLDEYKELVWEAAIPFAAIYGKTTLTPADFGKPLAICFEMKGMPKPKDEGVQNVNNNMSTGASGLRGGMAQGGMQGAPQGGMNNADPLQQLYSNTKTWKQFKLAVQ